MKHIVSGAKLKAMLVLVLVGLLAGLAQAQTVQVKKLWEIKPEGTEEVIACVVDTVNGGKDPWVVALVAGTLRAYDRQGVEREKIQLPKSGKLWWSKNLRYFGTFPNGVLLDRNGKSICRTPSYPGIVEIANDGQAFTIVTQPKGPGGPEPYFYNRSGDTIRFFDRKGQFIKMIPVPFRWYSEFSGDGSRFVVNICNNKGSFLQTYDRRGNLIWKADFPREGSLAFGTSYMISHTGSVFIKYARLKDPGYKWWHGNTLWGRFYDPQGKIESELQYGVADTVHCEKGLPSNIAISADGEYALVGDEGYLLKIAKSPPKIEWRYETKDPECKTYIEDAQLSSTGEYALVKIRRWRKWQKIVVFDRRGHIIFEDEKSPYYTNCFSEEGNFFVSYYSNTVALYEIVAQ